MGVKLAVPPQVFGLGQLPELKNCQVQIKTVRVSSLQGLALHCKYLLKKIWRHLQKDFTDVKTNFYHRGGKQSYF